MSKNKQIVKEMALRRAHKEAQLEEGFWDSVAKGMNINTGSNPDSEVRTLGSDANRNAVKLQAQSVADKEAADKVVADKKADDAALQSGVEVPEGQKLAVLDPKNKSVYFKDSGNNWTTEMHVAVTSQNSVNFLEKLADAGAGRLFDLNTTVNATLLKSLLTPKAPQRKAAPGTKAAANATVQKTSMTQPMQQRAASLINNPSNGIAPPTSAKTQSANIFNSKEIKMDNKQIVKEMATRRAHKEKHLAESQLNEGGNVFPDVTDIQKEYVPGLIKDIQRLMPTGIKIIPDIGSAGYKVASGDMDVFVDSTQIMDVFHVSDDKKGRAALKDHIEKQGFNVALSGRNVHVRMPVPDGSFVQVDVMVIPGAEKVAPFHTHGPSGQYKDPEFKGGQLFIMYSSIAKALGLKFSPFEGKLINRETNKVVADDKDSVAKILLNKQATAADLANVKTMLAALANDPQKDAKLAQAREDAKKGLINLPESKLRQANRRLTESRKDFKSLSAWKKAVKDLGAEIFNQNTHYVAKKSMDDSKQLGAWDRDRLEGWVTQSSNSESGI